MVKIIDGYRAILKAKLVASAASITITRDDAIKLNPVGVGNYTYLTIRDRVNTEIVRYDHVEDWVASDPALIQLPVTRNMRGLGAKNFPYGACITSEVNSLYIDDLIASAQGCISAPASAAAVTTDEALPTSMVGGRTSILGTPAGFFRQCDGKLVPYYEEE